ncbi:MAG: sugar kinase [Planctomycetota bacterium]
MKTVVTFGEIMARMATHGHARLRQARSLDVTYAGAEASVAASIAMLGGRSRYITALPGNALGDACLDAVRSIGVDTSHVLRVDDARLGLYFLETGANQRPSRVIYDRADSAVAVTPADAYDWAAAFDGADWLHVSGITPALSEVCADTTRVAVERAKASGMRVSCDLNFRGKLWRWDTSASARELARRTMAEIMPFVDVAIGNEEDYGDVLDIHAEGTDVHAGRLTIDRYPEVARRVVDRYANVSRVAVTLRESRSATHNDWGAMLFDAAQDVASFAPLDADGGYTPYAIKHIVDRVGGGDAFAAGLIFALTTDELAEPATAVRFAVAASCLAHSIQGDFNFATRAEVEALMNGSASGRVVR